MRLREAIEQGSGQAHAVYRVMASERRRSQSGQPYTRLELEDYSGRITAYAWSHQERLSPVIQNDVAEGLFEFRRFDGRVVADLLIATAIGPYTGGCASAALIPRSACPSVAHAALEGLVALCDALTVPDLRRLVDDVFADERLWPGFVAARASKNHHHARPGGLLMHSVDVALRCQDQCRGLTLHEAELVVVAGLLHDIGKVRTVGTHGARPPLGHWVHHEALTLELLAPHLQVLDERWPEGAAALRHCLTWYAVKPNGFSHFVGADILRAADGCDVALERGRRLPAALEGRAG